MIKMERAENDDDHHNNNNKAPTPISNEGRSYDCSFCKRGFTNAQALGGHMNIHRKDKAKVKANHNQDALGSSFFHPRIAPADYHQGRHVNYQEEYMPPPNPGIQTGNHEYCFFPVWRPDQDCVVDGNLKLKIGAVEEDGVQEVDLELRLGRLF